MMGVRGLVAHIDPTAEQPLTVGADAVDEELLALPAPARGRRLATMTLMALVVAASVGLATTLRADIAYFFSGDEVIDLGQAAHLDPARIHSNTFVRVQGMPMASETVRYGRMFGGGDFMVFPLAGQEHVFVQVASAAGTDPESVARGEFAGRIVTFGELGGRFREVRGYLEQRMGMPVSSESFLLMADEPPRSYLWALALAALCLSFVLIDLALLLRWFRPLETGTRG